MEATLEMCKKDWLVGVQDMGAAGITCSSSESEDVFTQSLGRTPGGRGRDRGISRDTF